MSAESPGRGRRWLVIAAIIVIVFGVLVAYLLAQQESASDVVVVPTSTPVEAMTPTESPSTGTETPTAAAAEPSDEDVDAFEQAHGPADITATGDIIGDAADEVVLASVRNNAVVIVVGMWDGQAYLPTFRNEGGPAQRVTALTVADRNGVPGSEIVTEQRAGTQGRSLSVWGPAGGDLRPQSAKGGCWDGSSTYGIAGATISDGRIAATCDGSPDPPETWSSDIYEWRKGRWTYVRTQAPGD